MSGFEVAGLVLGAFPLLISALEKYEVVARRYDFWRRIRPEYRKCSHDLKYHSDVFRLNLRQLLLPHVVDEEMVDKMIADPGGDEWKIPELAEMLSGRLHKSYDTYMEIMRRFYETMEELREELAVDSPTIQLSLDTTHKTDGSQTLHQSLVEKLRISLSKSNRNYQIYRLKFSNGAHARRHLLDALNELNERLEKLLKNCDKDSQIVSQRSLQPTSLAYERSLCEFWRQATSLFRVLCKSISCSCRSTHHASILLQEPKQDHAFEPDVRLLLMTQNQESWACRQAKVELKRTAVTDLPLQMKGNPNTQRLASQKHQHDDDQFVKKSALRLGGQTKSTKKATFASAEPPKPPFDTANTKTPNGHIDNFCDYFHEQRLDWGYLEEDDCRYHIYPDAYLVIPQSYAVTLQQVIRGDSRSLPLRHSRRKRTTLALTLASSFVQLVGSPWLPSQWSEGDIVFVVDDLGAHSQSPQVDQPHIRRRLEQEKTKKSAEPSSLNKGGSQGLLESLTRLGIVLLELCFGTTLDSQPHRLNFPKGQTPGEKAAFDLAAALAWLRDVNEEAGKDYANAVAWCLAISRAMPNGETSWRREMVQQVIRPLDACNQHLAA